MSVGLGLAIMCSIAVGCASSDDGRTSDAESTAITAAARPAAAGYVFPDPPTVGVGATPEATTAFDAIVEDLSLGGMRPTGSATSSPLAMPATRG